MKDMYFASLLILSLFLAACTGTVSTLPSAVTENPIVPSPTSSKPTPYPEPAVITIHPTTASYPEPSTPETVTGAIPASGYEPQSGDVNLKQSKVFLDLVKSQVVADATESNQVIATLQGNLPDPCHSLRVVVTPPDANNVINLEVYSVVDPGVACITVLKPFTADIPLGSYPAGQYSVMVNGEKLGEFGTSYEPQPGDDQLTRGEVFVDMTTSKLLTSGTQPLEASVILKGNLPTPCHQLRVVSTGPNENHALNLEVYSVVDPSVMCTTVLKPFETTIPLGSYPSEHILVYVNGELLGEFDE
jgi:hypothetical protein